MFFVPKLGGTQTPHLGGGGGGGAFSNHSFPPDFFQIFVKKLQISKNIFGTPWFFSDFCQKIPHIEKYFGVPPYFFQNFGKKNPYFKKKKSGIPPNFCSHFCQKKLQISKNILRYTPWFFYFFYTIEIFQKSYFRHWNFRIMFWSKIRF